MRFLIVALSLSLPLVACGKTETAVENRDGSGMTADAITSNDITAIDAVTGEAANMAADVDYNADMANALENAATNELSSSARSRPNRGASSPQKSDPAEPASNAAAPANSAE